MQLASACKENVAILVNTCENHFEILWKLCFLRYRSNDYRGDSNFNALFTPLTFLATYFNSGVNPLLYAILSRNFRKGMSELLICTFKPNKSKAVNKRTVTHVSNMNSVQLTQSNGNADKLHQLKENVNEFDSICNDFNPKLWKHILISISTR